MATVSKKPVVKPKPKPKPSAKKKVSPIQVIGPFHADNFSFIAKNPKGKWFYLNDFISSANWEDSTDESSLTLNLSLTNERADTSSNPEQGLLSDWCYVGMPVQMHFSYDAIEKESKGAKWQEVARFTVWTLDKGNSGGGGKKLELRCCDQMAYLKASYDTFLYTRRGKKKMPWTATQITRDICKRYKIPLGKVPKFKKMKNIPYLYKENISIFDFLVAVWTIEKGSSGRKFQLRFDKGKLNITEKTIPLRMWELRGTKMGAFQGDHLGNLTDLSYKHYIDQGSADDGTATSVTIRGVKKGATGEDRRTAVVARTITDAKLQNRIGRLHKIVEVEGLISKASADKRGKKFLKEHGIKEDGSFSALGIPFLRAGDAVFVDDPGTRIKGKFWTTQISQTLNGDGSYTMQGQLNLKSSVPEIKTNPDERKPVPKSAAPTTLPGGGTDIGTWSGAGMPTWLFPIMVRACTAVGVPEAWASSASLAQLLQHESNFKPNAKNPDSTAYGLFQFLDTTWTAVGRGAGGATLRKALGPMGPYNNADPYVQCVYGLLYIKHRYGNPDKAWSFWQSKSPHWY